jgi:hypothetical protein
VHEQRVSKPQTLTANLGNERTWVIGGILVTVAIVIWQLRLIGDYRVDDAYISFAFARNLARGQGLTYGAGLRVEGYSNFLWTVIAGIVQWITPNHLYEGVRILALACLAAVFWLSFKISRRYVSTPWALASVVLLAFATDMTGAVQSGLETMPYTAALLATVYCYLTEDPTRRRRSGWCLLLLGLLRIDGMVHMAFFIGWAGLSWLIAWRRPRVEQTVRWLAAPLLVYALYFGWRYHYYGLPLPLTYYAKSLIPQLLPNRGFDYVLGSILQLGLPVAMLLTIYGLGRRITCERLMLSALVTAQLAYAAQVGGDWMPFHRFVLPALPPLMVLFVWGMSDAWRQSRVLAGELRMAVLCALLAAGGFVIRMEDAHSIETVQERNENTTRLHVMKHTHDLVAASELFKWSMREPGEKLVTDYGGVFAYFTDADVIEMWGLCNKEIALHGNTNDVNPIYGKTCVPCYKEFEPVYFHANVPLARPVADFKKQSEVVAQIFQGAAIDKVLDFQKNYVTGRVVKDGLAFYFLERKRPGESFAPRHPAPGIVVEYPF